jgi:hypothetical protein
MGTRTGKGKSSTVCQVNGITHFYVESLQSITAVATRLGHTASATAAGERRRALVDAEQAYVLALQEAEYLVELYADQL